MVLQHRRRWGCVALASVVVAGVLGACLWLLSFDRRPGTWVDTVTVDELSPGVPLRAELDGVPIYITRLDDDTFYAVVAVVPHPNACDLVWFADAGNLVDPCIGSTFDAQGQYVRGPSPRGLDSYPTRVRNNRVQINLAAPIKGVLVLLTSNMCSPEVQDNASCLAFVRIPQVQPTAA